MTPAGRGEVLEDAILCFERLFFCDNPPLQSTAVGNVIDYICQVLEVTCIVLCSHSPSGRSCTPPPRQVILTNDHSGLVFPSLAQLVHNAYGDPKGVMMDIGRPTTVDFDRTRFPVRYYHINFAEAQQLSRDADPRGANFCSDVDVSDNLTADRCFRPSSRG
jgi:hypothetical protein